jgi:hypothetical protein
LWRAYHCHSFTFAIDYASTYNRTHFKFGVLSLILEVIYIVIYEYVKHTKSDYGRGYTLSNESDDQKAETHPQGHTADKYLHCIVLA